MGRPWYPKYPADYAFDTRHLTLAEHGAYNLMMDRYYAQEEPLPADAEQLFSICGARDEQDRAAVLRVCKSFFTEEGGKYRQKRIDEEIAKAKALSETRSKAALSKSPAKARNSRARATQLQSQSQPQSKPLASTPKGVSAVVSSSSPTSLPSSEALESARATPEKPAEEPDPIFGAGLAFLTGKGVKERAARGFLGLLRKEVGDLVAGELLALAEREDVSDPCGWLRAAAQRRGKGNGSAASGHGPVHRERACAVCGRTGTLVFTQAGDRCLEHRDVEVHRGVAA